MSKRYVPSSHRLAVLALSTGLVLTLAACGSNDMGAGATAPGASTSSSAATSANGIATAHNEADVMFIKEMTPHHAGALQMAEMATERASDPQVKDLATTIAAAQGPEKELMADMAAAWDVPAPGADMSGGGHDAQGGAAMPSAGMGADMADEMAALEAASGAAFDREFLTRMVAHHQGALPMAQAEVADGMNPQAKQLAQEIIDSQTAEIKTMQELLRTL